MLPKRIPKTPKRESRWRSLAHCNFVRSHACSVCGAMSPIEVAHVRIGSGAGMAQKPDDWNTVSLCKPCHQSQHHVGERTFWKAAGIDPTALAEAFAKASPKAAEIRAKKVERK
jgi:5-methylcytosine-specific restriction endonuclease McrA